eukprot:2471173-Prymnesium_polylepis.1
MTSLASRLLPRSVGAVRLCAHTACSSFVSGVDASSSSTANALRSCNARALSWPASPLSRSPIPWTMQSPQLRAQFPFTTTQQSL